MVFGMASRNFTSLAALVANVFSILKTILPPSFRLGRDERSFVEAISLVVSCRMLLKLQTSFTRSTMSLEIKEDKLSVREVASEDVQSGLQVMTAIIQRQPTKELLS